LKLLLFDLDGTLTRTDFADQLIFLEAFREKISPEIRSVEDYKLKNNTDNGDTFELYQLFHGRYPGKEELNEVIHCVVEKFRKLSLVHPEYFAAVEGAPELISYFLSEEKCRWHIGIATGCWYESALLKLKLSGLYRSEMPIATSDRMFSKAEIILSAVEKAKKMNKVSNYDKIVYVGDSYTDLLASLSLSIDFIGIQAENNLTKKISLRNYCKLENFRNIDNFISLLKSP